REVPGIGDPKVPGEVLVGIKSVFLNRFTSENGKFENPTPTSGPGGVLRTPSGKCCWMMNPAVREVNAFSLLLKNAAVPAFETALAIWVGVGSPPATFQTP